VAVDTDEQAVEELRERGLVALCGDATDDAVLLNAGVKRARAVAAVTSSAAANAMICLTVRALAPKAIIIARAEDESSVPKLQRAGASVVINPTEYGGDGVAECMVRPEVARLLFGRCDGDEALRFAELAIDARSPHAGKPLGILCEAHPELVFIASCSGSGGLLMGPKPEHVLREGEILVIAGAPADVARISAHRLAA